MSSKRNFGTIDHMMHNKLSRLEMASQRSTACFGVATSQDLQNYQNFMSYPIPESERHGSSTPWSSTTAYLQYAGSALNEHMQTREASVKYQRPQAEQQHNPLQLPENPTNQGSVHQSPSAHSYHMSSPRACPPIAMPRPVYRSPGNFMDSAYGARGLQSLGVCVATQSLYPPTVEWNSSARFPPPSPLYSIGTKKHLSTSGTYPEVARSPSSLSQGMQEQNTVYRHHADMSLAVGVSSTYSQKDIFTDACHSVAQQNVQLLYTEGSVPLGRQRTSAFTTPSPKHKNGKPNAYQGSTNHRIGHLHPKNVYNNPSNSIHQRTSQFPCNMELTGSPQHVRGHSVYPNREQHMHSGYVQTSQLDGTLQPTDRPHKTVTDIPVRSPQRDKNMWVQSGQWNRDLCGMVNRVDKEMFNPALANGHSFPANSYHDLFTGQGVHAAFVQQRSSSLITEGDSNHETFSGQHASRNSVTLEASSLHSSIHSFEDGRATGTVDNTTIGHRSTSQSSSEHAESSVPSQSSVVGNQYQMNHSNVRLKQDAALLSSPNRDLPSSNAVAVGEQKPAPLASENMAIENPKSPPMPVINDVFSLAPYRAYLEGKAPHPFATPQESDAEASTSAFVESTLSNERTEKTDGMSSITKVVHAENKTVIKDHNRKYVETAAQEASTENTGTESVVLDLSLKKLPLTGSSTCNQQDNLCHGKDTLYNATPENCSDKAKTSIQDQDSYVSSDTSRISHMSQEPFSSHSHSILPLSQETYHPPFSGDKLNKLSNENVLCHRQKTILQSPKASPWHLRDSCQTQTKEMHKNNLEENSLPLGPKSLSSRHKESHFPQDMIRLPSQHQKRSPCQMTEQLSQHLRKKHHSQDYRSNYYNVQDSYNLHSSKSLLCLPQDKSSSHVLERLPQQDLSSSTSQTLRTLPVNTSVQNPSCSGFSVVMNTMQTQASLVPVILPSPPTLYFTNTVEVHTSRPPSGEKSGQSARNPLESSHSLSSPSGSENESNGFHSSKSFMFRKYKMKKLSSSEEETQRVNAVTSSNTVSNPFLSDTVQSLPPSAPESSPSLGEANVSLASVGEPSLSSGKQFSELHRSVQSAISSAVARSPSSLLEDWLSKTKEEDLNKATVKTKSSFRSNDQSSDMPDHDIWLAFDGVRLLLHKLLSQLETFMFTRSCPFPHVIRAGAIFIPIYQVKEVLFPELLAPAVDKILQKHKVELRPTTLSEEKLLRETELKTCSSRMLKLLALKQLPDVYPDLLRLFCRNIIQHELGKNNQSVEKEELKLTDSPKKGSLSVSSKKVKSSLTLKRVQKLSGINVYKTKKPKTPQKKDKLQKRPVCRKKPRKTRPVFSYKKRRRCKRFPNLVGRRILHLFDDGEQEVWFRGKVVRVHRRSRKRRDTQFEVWYDDEPGTRYFLELLQDYEKGWLQLDG